MISNNLSLIPMCEARRAVLQAIEYVGRRRERHSRYAEFPYAQAFFRFLKGSKRITIRELRYFEPVLRGEDLRGRRREWLRAIDWLIESGGCVTWPLPHDAARDIFPEALFQIRERRQRREEMRDEKYTRQYLRKQTQQERTRMALTGQAEIELAFQTPATVASWASKWANTEVRQSDLITMFFRWGERFPSMAGFERRFFYEEPLWKMAAEARYLSEDSTETVRELERWMVPNKLTQGRVSV